MKFLFKFRNSNFSLAKASYSFGHSNSDFKVQASGLLLLFLGVWSLEFGVCPSASAQQTNTPGKLDYASFKIVTERNIFNSHRSARYAPRTEATPQARVDSFALVGTMSYEKGLFAFFDGTSSEYRKSLQINDQIAGFKIAGIESAFVKLASPTNEIQLPVGMQMRREDKGEWRLGAQPDVPATRSERSPTPRPAVAAMAPSRDTPRPPSNGEEPQVIFIDPETQLVIREPQTQPAVSNAAPGTASGGSESDILERLRLRREQESNQ
jgi:hypothetical protein